MLRYPVMFVHGLGFHDRKLINYWGRIPKVFTDDGNQVFYGCQDGAGTVEDNAYGLKQRIEKILADTGAEKLNVIAHSKGGLDMRYAISNLGMSRYVASLTTINTPHNGSKTIDKILSMPQFPLRFASGCADVWLRVIGDKKPNTYKSLCSLATESACQFDKNTPDMPETYYQSYACMMNKGSDDIFMLISYEVVKRIEGENDGLLTPACVKHGDFKGIRRSNSHRGISHLDQIDMRRRRFTKKSGNGVSDILEIYSEILHTLQDKGF